MGKKKDTRWVRTTAEMEEILEDSLQTEHDGSWDPIADQFDDVQGLKLTEYMMHDDVIYLVFNNGHVERLTHPEGGDFANDGDYWYVGGLGWA